MRRYAPVGAPSSDDHWPRFALIEALSAPTVDHHRGLAATVMVATSAACVHEARSADETAARAGIPLIAWVAFAIVLTASIWGLNRRR